MSILLGGQILCLFGGGREVGTLGGGKKERFFRGSLIGLTVHRLAGLKGGRVVTKSRS